jgi:hypothetical protein
VFARCGWKLVRVCCNVGHSYCQDYVALRGPRACEDAAYADLVLNLADDASRRNWSLSGAMPTLRSRSCFFSPWLGRLVTPSELFAAHGFPTYPCLSAALGLPMVELPRSDPKYALRALGSSMHVASIGVVLLVALACTGSP